MVREIELTQGQVAIVDDEDYEWINQWKWYAKYSKRTKGFYAVRSKNLGMVNGKQKLKKIYMARLIMDEPKDMVVDHINHDSLDNRKKNLRVVSNRQNMQNKKRKYTSKYPGVYWRKDMSKWRAAIRIDGKEKHLGLFDDEREAAKAYEAALRELCGEELVCKVER